MLFGSFNGLIPDVRVKISGAEPFRVLGEAPGRGIVITDAVQADECTLFLSVSRRKIPVLRRVCERLGVEMTALPLGGLYSAGRKLRKRALAAALLTAAALLCVYSRAFIWDIYVEGNELVSTGEILSALSECGVRIGSCWLGFTSDSIRNDVIVRCPNIAWLTVNMHGSRAEVIVRERIKKPEMIDPRYPASIVASRDGVVTEVCALYGSAQTRPGAAVVSGETLISGRTVDIDGDESLVHACGEVWARTYYDEIACIPEKMQQKVYTGREERRWSLKIGTRRINFFGKYSNSDIHCDKIYTEHRAKLASLFTLPLSLICERRVYYDIDTAGRGQETEEILGSGLYERLPEEVISENLSFYRENGLLFAELRAECLEQIGETQPIFSGEKGTAHD